jgi:hypothetical protein
VKAGGKQSFFFDPEDGSDMFSLNVGCLSMDYKFVISKKIELFINTAVRTSDPYKMFRDFFRHVRRTLKYYTYVSTVSVCPTCNN